MSNEKQIYDAAMQTYAAAIAEEQANYQKAQITGDIDEAARASQAIASYRVQAEGYHRMAESHVQTLRQQPQGNKYGLSPTEVEVAKNSFGEIVGRNGRKIDLTEDEKCELYSRNKSKLARMRASGEYRQTTDQG